MEQKKNIYITTNVSCNLRCTYCYEDKSGNEEFDVELTKRRLFDILTKNPNDSFIINLHGGEPFLVFQKIKELCEWVWEQNVSNEYLFFATTNGTKVHGEIKDWLYKNRQRFIAGLSLDGTREMHNINRSNSFDLIDIDFFVKNLKSHLKYVYLFCDRGACDSDYYNACKNILYIYHPRDTGISSLLSLLKD